MFFYILFLYKFIFFIIFLKILLKFTYKFIYIEMLPTGNQLSSGLRVSKRRRNRVAAFEGAPMRKGVVYKIAVMTPRKPNSARRTFAKVRIIVNQKRIFAKIPGIGEHHLQAHSVVLVRGHGPKDSPGINYHLIVVFMILIGLKFLGVLIVVRSLVLKRKLNSNFLW